MNKQEQITGEWIKQEMNKVTTEFKTYSHGSSFTNFVFDPKAKELWHEIYRLRSICPHNFVENKCIYCGKTNQAEVE